MTQIQSITEATETPPPNKGTTANDQIEVLEKAIQCYKNMPGSGSYPCIKRVDSLIEKIKNDGPKTCSCGKILTKDELNSSIFRNLCTECEGQKFA